MITTKRCNKCNKYLDVSEFDLMKPNRGRPRRRPTCRSCLENAPVRQVGPAIDYRDMRCDIEAVFAAWRRE